MYTNAEKQWFNGKLEMEIYYRWLIFWWCIFTVFTYKIKIIAFLYIQIWYHSQMILFTFKISLCEFRKIWRINHFSIHDHMTLQIAEKMHPQDNSILHKQLSHINANYEHWKSFVCLVIVLDCWIFELFGKNILFKFFVETMYH